MRRLLLIGVLLFFAIEGQAQVFVGLRDTRYVYAGYSFSGHWRISAEHSLFSEHIGFQKIRLYGSFAHQWKYIECEIKPYISTLWNGHYQDFGALITGRVYPFKIWCVDATINPHGDTENGYTSCYRVGTSVAVSKEMALLLHYQNIPEYRMPEKRFRIGARFAAGKLNVTLEISVPATKDAKNIRVMCGMEYLF